MTSPNKTVGDYVKLLRSLAAWEKHYGMGDPCDRELLHLADILEASDSPDSPVENVVVLGPGQHVVELRPPRNREGTLRYTWPVVVRSSAGES